MRKLRARQVGLVIGALVISFWWARLTGGLAASSDEPGSVLPSRQPGGSESTPLPPNPATPPAPAPPPATGIAPGLPQSRASPASPPALRSPFEPAPGVFPDTRIPSPAAPPQPT